MIDFNNKGFFKLKQNDEYAERVSALLIDGEHVIDAYKSMRDGVVFTNKRIISVNVQGITGSKKRFHLVTVQKHRGVLGGNLGHVRPGLRTGDLLLVAGKSEIRIHRQDFDGGNFETDFSASALT